MTSHGDIIGETSRRITSQGILGFICILLLAGILYAGLTPFHAPANQVAWIAGVDGLRLREHGTLFSRDPFPPPGANGVERTLEIWVQPGKIEDSSTLLAFFDPASSRGVSIRQERSDLVICIGTSVAWRAARSDKLFVPNGFHDGKRTFWTVTLGHAGTAAYRNGALVLKSPLTATSPELGGRLIVSGSPIFDDSWSGILSGLAVYDSALSQSQISRHYTSWANGPAPAIASDDRCIGLYTFNEHSGDTAHNRVGSQDNLYIPLKYTVLRKTLLDPVWRAFSWNRGFWQDAWINVTGFIPFGCFFCAWFSAGGFSRPAVRATVAGAAVSLFIEVTQKFLPTRDSSMADLIDNTLGTVIGAAVCRGVVAHAINRGISLIINVIVNAFE
jgi:hypothetical protein